jgi:hypothetical protein
MPGETFSIELEGEDQIHLTRRNDELAPLVDVDYHPLFEKIGVAGVLAVFKAILAEGHVILVSSDIELLARCAQAALGLLYPFVWQHIYVPVLPASWLDYVTAPMPFVVGIHSSMLDQVLEMPLEESLLIAKLDSGEVMLCGEAGGHGTLPAASELRLEKSLAKLQKDFQRGSKSSAEGASGHDFSLGVLHAVVDEMVLLFGKYRDYVNAEAEPPFDIEGFIEESDAQTNAFLRGLTETQCFDTWCRERVALSQEGFPRRGIFECRVDDSDVEDADYTAKDLPTARMIVDVSQRLRSEPGLGTESQLLLDQIRRQPVWKNVSLWRDMFEDKLRSEANLALLTAGSTVGLGLCVVPSRRKSITAGLSARRKSISENISAAMHGGDRLQPLQENAAASMSRPSMRKVSPPGDEPAGQAPRTVVAKELKREAGQLSRAILAFAEIMMLFGLPLDLVSRFSDTATSRHGLGGELAAEIKESMMMLFPKFVHLQDTVLEGWLEVETKNTWDPRWMVVRGTSFCIHESDSHRECSVFPVAACEVGEPKSKRKKPYTFRIDVAAYAVGQHAATTGTASKHVALKFIVAAESEEEKQSWMKTLHELGGQQGKKLQKTKSKSSG